MQLLRRMQTLLAQLYDAPVREDVQDFVLSDPRRLREAVGEQAGEGSDEQVFVVQDEQGVRLGVFIESGVLDRLTRRDPLLALDEDNLADFCTALEGVSHFTYYAWNAARDKVVSLFELELQAEVDKYVLGAWLLRAQGGGRFPRELHRVLFDRAHVDPGIAGERTGLYRRASVYAGRFCRRVAARLERARRASARNDLRPLLAELRRFYRWGSARKFSFIENLA